MVVSPKLKKIFDGTDPPSKKAFFGGGSGGLKAKDLGYVSGRYNNQSYSLFKKIDPCC